VHYFTLEFWAQGRHRYALLGQAGGYAAGALDGRLGKKHPISRDPPGAGGATPASRTSKTILGPKK